MNPYNLRLKSPILGLLLLIPNSPSISIQSPISAPKRTDLKLIGIFENQAYSRSCKVCHASSMKMNVKGFGRSAILYLKRQRLPSKIWGMLRGAIGCGCRSFVEEKRVPRDISVLYRDNSTCFCKDLRTACDWI